MSMDRKNKRAAQHGQPLPQAPGQQQQQQQQQQQSAAGTVCWRTSVVPTYSSQLKAGQRPTRCSDQHSKGSNKLMPCRNHLCLPSKLCRLATILCRVKHLNTSTIESRPSPHVTTIFLLACPTTFSHLPQLLPLLIQLALASRASALDSGPQRSDLAGVFYRQLLVPTTKHLVAELKRLPCRSVVWRHGLARSRCCFRHVSQCFSGVRNEPLQPSERSCLVLQRQSGGRRRRRSVGAKPQEGFAARSMSRMEDSANIWGGISAGSKARPVGGNKVEEDMEDAEDFLPSSLSDLLTPAELDRRRRSNRLSSSFAGNDERITVAQSMPAQAGLPLGSSLGFGRSAIGSERAKTSNLSTGFRQQQQHQKQGSGDGFSPFGSMRRTSGLDSIAFRESNSGLSTSASRTAAHHAPGQSLPQGLAAGLSRLHLRTGPSGDAGINLASGGFESVEEVRAMTASQRHLPMAASSGLLPSHKTRSWSVAMEDCEYQAASTTTVSVPPLLRPSYLTAAHSALPSAIPAAHSAVIV